MLSDLFITLFVCALITGLFLVSRKLNSKFPSPLLNPLLLCIVMLSAVLVFADINYQDFSKASYPIHFFLEVAVVALAYPLYKQMHEIKRSLGLLLLSGFIGVTSATLIAFILCKLFAVPDELLNSLMALSVTTPITLIITDKLNGIPAIAAFMVILIGMFGAVFGLSLLHLFKVKDQRVKGLTLGVVCHGIGTAAAIEHHPQAGAFASAAMIISALITAIWVPTLYTIMTQLIGG
ncbi:LrgB family protein [Pseudoalteromonas sp. BZB3]|uniref:LrgB family protein n=1 Tax=Pseudoalteromonas sp. BZB3 TaxID=3136670 RepID=UPI0032C4506B